MSHIIHVPPFVHGKAIHQLRSMNSESDRAVAVAASIVSLLPTSSSVANGGNTNLLATINAPQGSNTVINISTDSPSIFSVPPTVTVLAGNTSVSVPVSCNSVGTGNILATLNGSVSASINVYTPSGVWLHEPPGMLNINNWGHDLLTQPGGWYDVYGGFQTSIVSDGTAPLSPPNVLQQRWPAGGVGGNTGGGGNLFDFPRAYGSVFWGQYLKLDPIFEQHPNGSKLGWIHTELNGVPQNNQLIFSCISSNPYAFRVTYQNANVDNTHLGAPVPGTVNLFPSSQSQFNGGEWVKLEQYFKPASALNVLNGIWRMWVNDVLVMDITNLNTERILPDAVSHITVWGGTGSVKTRDSFVWWDHEYISVAD